MSRFTSQLEIGRGYERKELAMIWRLGGYQAIGRGVFTPKGINEIFLFVTRERLSWMTLYNNYLADDLLFWDGEKGHGNDDRIVNAQKNGDTTHLFYRDQRHTPFTYHGQIMLLRCDRFIDRPSEFVFRLASGSEVESGDQPTGLAEDSAEYNVLTHAGVKSIDRQVLAKSRGVAQRLFRGNLLRLWQGSCAVTGVREARVLRSSHIKPWKSATIDEKVDHFNGLLLIPNLDSLFNEGLISFRDNGRILVSDSWDMEDKRRMQITPDLRLRQINAESKPYLEYHRDLILKC